MLFLNLAFGLVIFLAAVVIVIDSAGVLNALVQHKNSRFIYISAISVRLIVGGSLILKADQSNFPLAIAVIGWAFVFFAGFLAVIGHGHFIRLISWVLHRFAPHVRLIGLFALGFGGFILYAFV